MSSKSTNPSRCRSRRGTGWGQRCSTAARPADAERVYRDDLRQHPHNGWALFGLQLALKAQGKPSGEVETDLRASWSRSDTWIRASRF